MQVRGRGLKVSQREQRAVFAAIALSTACVVLAPVLLAMMSSRPDLYLAKPKPVSPGIEVVDWQSLDSLLSETANPAAARPDWFGPEVQIAGYMIPVTQGQVTVDQAQQKVAHFLLVPEAGDWLNPPHFHAGEVIDVRLRDGAAARLVERTPVTVRGRLSFGSMNTNSRAVLFLAEASVE